jgi:hypothetical protein
MVFDFYYIKCLSRTFLHQTSRNALKLTPASLRVCLGNPPKPDFDSSLKFSLLRR